MSPDESWFKCESIVQNLDDQHRELRARKLQQAVTQILFIFTRCMRLLQYQKYSAYGKGDHVLDRHQLGGLGFYPDQATSGDSGGSGLSVTLCKKAIKDKPLRMKLKVHGLGNAFLDHDFAGRLLRHSFSTGTESPGSTDGILSWKKLPSVSEKNKTGSDEDNNSTQKKVLDFLPHLGKRKMRLDESEQLVDESLVSGKDIYAGKNRHVITELKIEISDL